MMKPFGFLRRPGFWRGAWRQLEARERLALTLLGGVLLLLLFYFGAWRPATGFLQTARDFHASRAALVSRMQATRKDLQLSARSALGNDSLLALVTGTASAAGLQPDRVQPEGEAGVLVQFDEVAFNRLAVWLERLDRDLELRRVRLDRAAAPGMVSARILAETRGG